MVKRALIAAVVATGALVAPRAFGEEPTYGPRVPRAASPNKCTVPSDLTGTITLPSDCAYDDAFVITTSATTLDCNGAQLRAGKGIIVRGDVSDVKVENCWLEGTSGLSINPPDRLDGETEEAWRLRSPKRVVISHVAAIGSKGSGVFIGPAVDGAVLEGSLVEGSESAGVYLEHGTVHTKVRANLVRKNGLRAKGVDRTEWTRREGVAVDASAYNEIEDNRFEANAFGGVFLYKNCWEHSTTDPKSPPRPLHAMANVIRRNVFVDMPMGVWIASRQARDLGAWDCGDASPHDNPIKLTDAFPPGYPTFRSTYPARYDVNLEYLGAALEGRVCKGGCSPNRDEIWAWEDFAEDNVVEENRFERIGLAGVRVEDDRARVVGNTFAGDFDFLYVGTPLRSRFLGHPVRGTVVKDNAFVAIDSRPRFEDHIALVPDEHEGTVLEGNHCIEPCTPPPVSGDAPNPVPGKVQTDRAEERGGGGCTVGGRNAATDTCVTALLLLGATLAERRERRRRES